MTHRVRFVALAVLVVAMTGGALVYAQVPGPGGPRGRGPGGVGPGMGRGAAVELRGLDLTEAQREQVRQLRDQFRAQTRVIADRVRTAQEARAAAMTSMPVDEARIRAAMEQVADAQADLAVQEARLMGDIRALLTPEQLQRLEQQRAARETRMEERRQRMQERRAQRQQN